MKWLLYFLICMLAQVQGIFSEASSLEVRSSARLFETQLILEPKTDKEINPPGWNLRNGFPLDSQTDVRYLNRSTNSLLTAGLHFKKNSEDLRVHLDFDVVKRTEVIRDALYAGKDSYIALNISKFWVGVGKRQFLFRDSPFSGYSDGGEGLFLERDFEKHWKFQFFLWDHYRGYRLLEKEYLRPEQLSDIEVNATSSQRRRHSFGLVYDKEVKLTLGVSYLEFGTFGKQSKELTQNVARYGADGDSVMLGNLGAKFNLGNFYSSFECLWAKGVDRTQNKSTTTPGSLLIEGEAFSFGSGYADGFLSLGLSGYLSDQEERNSQNQIVKLGYINTGTHIGSTYYLSQYLQMYPSSHFTQNGLERNNSILAGSPQSSYGEIFMSVYLFEIYMKLTYAILLPYKSSGYSDGKISVKKEYYENFYLSEISYELSYKTNTNQIGVLLSYLSAPSPIDIRGTMINCYGSIAF